MAIILVRVLDTTEPTAGIQFSAFRFSFLLALPLPLPWLPASVVFELFTFLVLAVAKTFVPHFIQDISAPHVQFLLVTYFARFRLGSQPLLLILLLLRLSLTLSILLTAALCLWALLYMYIYIFPLHPWSQVSAWLCVLLLLFKTATNSIRFICFVSVFLTSNTYLNFMNLNSASSW